MYRVQCSGFRVQGCGILSSRSFFGGGYTVAVSMAHSVGVHLNFLPWFLAQYPYIYT